MSDIAKKIPGQNDPIQEVLTPEQEEKLILGLMSGDLEPKNDMVAYFATKLKDISQSGSALQKAIDDGDKKLAAMREQLFSHRVAAETYKGDLLEWNRRD